MPLIGIEGAGAPVALESGGVQVDSPGLLDVLAVVDNLYRRFGLGGIVVQRHPLTDQTGINFVDLPVQGDGAVVLDLALIFEPEQVVQVHARIRVA